MNSGQSRRATQGRELVIDSVLSTQPELGPSMPDGGYGWVVFTATLFFQGLIPSLIVSYGIFLAFSRLPNLIKGDINPKLWDDNLVYAPLFFISSWTFFDPSTRSLITNSTWPRLVATAGTCLTCAGLLFLWLGLAGYAGTPLFILAGLTSGIGASVQISQCEILLAQYFRLKHPILAYITQAVTALGFIVAPIVVGHHILNSNVLQVILWYQAVILQGLIFNLCFRKPPYLKSKRSQQPNNYNYISTNPEDEEDIFSKNSRELQIKRQNSTGTDITIEKHQIPTKQDANIFEPSSSGTSSVIKSNWETFDDNVTTEDDKYDSMKKEWETFDDDDEAEAAKTGGNQVKARNLQLELSFAENTENHIPATDISGKPMPLFSDLPLNNNNTYSYDVLEQEPRSIHQPAVFMPITVEKHSFFSSLELLQQPTFYKSLLTVMTTKFSVFVYYTLFPAYLYQEVQQLRMREVTSLVGILSLSSFLFSGVSYWINIDKRRRPVCLWCLCWVGSFGYFMVSDADTKYFLVFGAIQVTLSIASLQYVGMPLLGLTLRGETSKEFSLISGMCGCAFLFFLIINSTFKDCFRLMALLHFFTGAVWFANYVYKKIIK